MRGEGVCVKHTRIVAVLWIGCLEEDLDSVERGDHGLGLVDISIY